MKARRAAVELALTSFAALFLELMAIRWLASKVQVVAMFANLVVLSSFLGLGLGCLAARRRDTRAALGPLLLALAALPRLGRALGIDLRVVDEIAWAALDSQPTANLAAVPWILAVFGINALVFVPLGQVLARRFVAVRDAGAGALVGYGIDIAGSFAGVVAFAAASALGAPPLVWFAVVGSVALLLLADAGRLALAANVAAIAIAVFLARPEHATEEWSPYYCIETKPIVVARGQPVRVGSMVFADGHRLQDALSLGPEIEGTPLEPWGPYYRLPYHLFAPRSVLILGAGAGNEVAAALDGGAERIVAVDIDPVIAQLGRTLHPRLPYRDPRVELVVDDARGFLARTSEQFDLVVISALDSARQLAGMSNLRLESFVYTVESFRAIREHLRPGGVFVLNMISARPWVGSRIALSLEAAFGAPPRVFATPHSPFNSLAFVNGGPSELVDRSPGTDGIVPLPPRLYPPMPLATDDWPHLYLLERTVPWTYVALLAVIVACAAVSVRVASPASARGVDAHFLLLGAGFMLLETRSITALALLFGGTWSTNVVVIGSILLVIFLGNALVALGRAPGTRTAYVLLGASLFLSWTLSVEPLLQLGLAARIAWAAALAGMPILFASFVFSRSFARAASLDRALGSNLLGALVGGALEYGSTRFGLQALYLIALGIYAASALALLRRRGPAAPITC